jgi:hypothetical protein
MAKDRYVSFGERVGAVPALTLPLDDVTPSFRIAVWNTVEPLFKEHDLRTSRRDVYPSSFLLVMAEDKRWLKEPLRAYENNRAQRFLRDWLTQDAKWHEVYEFIESFPRWANFRDSSRWEASFNEFLENERSPYRFVTGRLTPITSEQEQAEVAEAASRAGKFGVAAEHMRTALAHFSARPKPDYDNTCKEAASAVEAALNIANGKPLAVGDAVKQFAKAHSVHPALMESASKLFGYASDRDGVRHANKGTSAPVDFDEAKLVIVAASAWVNFIAAKAP